MAENDSKWLKMTKIFKNNPKLVPYEDLASKYYSLVALGGSKQ